MEDDTLWTNKMELIVGSLAVGFFVDPRRNSICIDSLAGGCDIYSPWGKVCEQLVWENTLLGRKWSRRSALSFICMIFSSKRIALLSLSSLIGASL